MKNSKFYWHYPLIITVSITIVFGLLILCSTSMNISRHLYQTPFHFLFHQVCYILFSLLMAFIVIRIPIDFWEKISLPFLIGTFILLILVLLPGIGHRVNGSIRWINFKLFSLQVSELAKISVTLYGADYVVRHNQEVKLHIKAFFKPMLILGILAYLLLMEPDFGALVVITLTFLSILYIAGARLFPFIIIFILATLFLSTIATLSPYRLTRLVSFLNPWQHPYDSGYQLIQSLIAFGRGGLFGVGFGNSIQKLFYLPEAHTDFLFAILAEEFGILGEFILMILFATIAYYGLKIAYNAKRSHLYFHCYLSFGLTITLILQAVINICVNTGLLPTKGLTLPFISYGGSSILFSLLSIIILLRTHHETNLARPF